MPKLIVNRIGRYFVTGILAILPMLLTVGVLAWGGGMVAQFLGPNTIFGRGLSQVGTLVGVESTDAVDPELSGAEDDQSVAATPTILDYVVGWIIVLGFVLLLGVLFELGARKFIQTRMDALLKRVPVVGNVYGTATQLVQMLDSKSDSEMKQMSVVYCTFGSQGGSMFLALMPTSHKFRVNEIDYCAVLIPTAPVPFGGGLVFVPADNVTPADNISIDALMSIYVSMGVSAPEFMPTSQ